MGGWEAPNGIELRVDAFSAIVLLIVSGASFVSLLAGRSSLAADVDAERQPLFYAAWLLALAGLNGIVVSADAFNIFVFMEISSLASYILVAGGRDRRALPAAFKYLIMGTIGATFYLIGVGLIYLMTGTLNLADMEARILAVADQRPILGCGRVHHGRPDLESGGFPVARVAAQLVRVRPPRRYRVHGGVCDQGGACTYSSGSTSSCFSRTSTVTAFSSRFSYCHSG